VVLERHPHRPLDGPLIADGQPDRAGQRDGQDLQPEMAERMIRH